MTPQPERLPPVVAAEVDYHACYRMWAEKIFLQIGSATRPENPNGSHAVESTSRRMKITARAWFHSHDFRATCAMLSLDAEWISAGVAKLIAKADAGELDFQANAGAGLITFRQKHQKQSAGRSWKAKRVAA